MFDIIKKNFKIRDCVERVIAIGMGAMAGWWLYVGCIEIAVVILFLAIIDPRWFGED